MKQRDEEERQRRELVERYDRRRDEERKRRREEYEAELKAEEERKNSMEYRLEQAERMRAAAELEKAEIAAKLKERQRRRELEEQVRMELIDSGELFGDQPKRPPIPREVVDAVYRRDGARCVYCGSTENLQLDHIIPFSKGGATSLENLQLLCQKCNLEKSNKIG
jgi:5-methylcytosine-specific restriction endonuclease McrA